MKLKLISNDIKLQQSLNNTGYFADVTISSDLSDTTESNVVVISDRQVDINELSLFFSEYDNYRLKGSKAERKVFYMLSGLSDTQYNTHITSICEAKDVVVIPPKLTIKQIIDFISNILFPDLITDSHKSIVFFGADSKVGTTMTAHSCAQMLAKNTNLKVGLLFLNDDIGTHYVKSNEDQSSGLDEIKTKLFNNILSPEELLQICIQDSNLYILRGVNNLLDQRFYHPEHVEMITDICSRVFDLLIIDAGENIHNALTIGSLKSSKLKYLVTTQQEVTRKAYEQKYSQVLRSLQYKPNDFLLIGNKYIKSNSIYNGKQLADLYKMNLATTLPHLEFLGWQAEIEQKTLLQLNSEEYTYQIDQLCILMAKQLHINYQSDVIKSAGFMSNLFSNKNKRRG